MKPAKLVPLVAIGAGLAALAAVALLLLESVGLTNPRDYAQPDPKTFRYERTPKTVQGLDFADIDFPAPDGATIRGWLVPAQDDAKEVAVVVLHGRGDDRRFALRHLAMMHGLGAGVALIDLRENGLSDGAGRGMRLGVREAEDGIAAAQEMRRLGYGRVVLFGCSLGGAAAVLAAAQEPGIAGLVIESPVTDFETLVADWTKQRLEKRGIHAPWAAELWGRATIAVTRARLGLWRFDSPDSVVAGIAPRPLLVVSGDADLVTPTRNARALVERAGKNAALLTVPQANHCDSFNVAPDAYRTAFVALLEKVKAAPQAGGRSTDTP